jgi:hypothetical protein
MIDWIIRAIVIVIVLFACWGFYRLVKAAQDDVRNRGGTDSHDPFGRWN